MATSSGLTHKKSFYALLEKRSNKSNKHVLSQQLPSIEGRVSQWNTHSPISCSEVETTPLLMQRAAESVESIDILSTLPTLPDYSPMEICPPPYSVTDTSKLSDESPPPSYSDVKVDLSKQSLADKIEPLPSKSMLLEKVLQTGIDPVHLRGISEEHLFLPEPNCHLEVDRYFNGAVKAIYSFKNHKFLPNNGRFNHTPYGLYGGVKWFYKNGNLKAESDLSVSNLLGVHALKTEGYFAWYDKAGQKVEDCIFRNGKKNGKDTRFGSSGKKVSECMMVNDKEDGLYTWFYENGVKSGEVMFVGGKRNGPHIWFNENGVKIGEAMLLKGKQNGLHVWFNENGVKIGECMYVNDKRNGLYTWFDEEGLKAGECMLVNDKREGLETTLYKNGRIQIKTYWKNNKKNGIQEFYNESGEFVKSILWNKGYQVSGC